jgi:hypothetical protein
MCHNMILLHNGSAIRYLIRRCNSQNAMFNNLNIIGFSLKGKLTRSNFVLVCMLSGFTVMSQHLFHTYVLNLSVVSTLCAHSFLSYLLRPFSFFPSFFPFTPYGFFPQSLPKFFISFSSILFLSHLYTIHFSLPPSFSFYHPPCSILFAPNSLSSTSSYFRNPPLSPFSFVQPLFYTCLLLFTSDPLLSFFTDTPQSFCPLFLPPRLPFLFPSYLLHASYQSPYYPDIPSSSSSSPSSFTSFSSPHFLLFSSSFSLPLPLLFSSLSSSSSSPLPPQSLLLLLLTFPPPFYFPLSHLNFFSPSYSIPSLTPSHFPFPFALPLSPPPLLLSFLLNPFSSCAACG